MAALNSSTQFVNNFSTHSLSDFFTQRISRFVPLQENLNYIITQESKFEKFSELTKIGEATFDNAEDLIVFSCKYDGPITSRSSRRRQFDIAKKVLQEDFKDGAIFVYHDQYKKFRFSFIRKNYAEKGVSRYSPWKRYTYFVDPVETNKTFKDRIGNCAFSNLETIQEAFSVEKLTKDFYNRLFEWFQWTVSDEVGITYPNDTTIAEDDREKLEVQVIRLTTRLLFVWFIKQQKLVPESLFNKEHLASVLNDFDPTSSTDGSYYNAILQNLFFATLNKTIGERAFAKLENKDDLKTLYRYAELFSIPEDEVLGLFNAVPFLNGGLFECLDKVNSDGKKIYLDGFSRNHKKAANGNFKHRAFIPNCVFFDEKKGIIPILEQYNFTVEENDPNEVQVALDPELLGNVFENLLGAFNKETRDSARKQSGSFYTPRAIVSYMVDESLIAYLQHNLPEVDSELIRELFENETLPEVLQQDDALRNELSTTLRKVKILDPACGSGAFPMGILNKMMQVFQKLDQDTDFSETQNKQKNYARKLHLIEECIYGIDIQPIATQISKLRFFISLVVDEDRFNPEAENYGIRSLPNLETKFVAANTLISPGRRPAKGQFSLENIEISEKKQELLTVRKKHFYAPSAAEKTELRKQDNQLREQLSNLLQENSEFASEDAKNIAKWNPYDQNESASFFDLDWMFGLEDGFDIVIGNPPYFSLSTDGKDDKGNVIKHNKLYDKSQYSSFSNSGDIYGLFYERGWQLLRKGGHLCFITSNKWMRAGYGESTRKFFAENTNPLLLVDFAGQKLFESATVDTNILLFSKGKNLQQTKACIVKEKVLKKLADYIHENATETTFATSDSWIVLSEIEQRIKAKIEAVGTPLKDWDIKINYGIKTGYNEAFIIDGKKRDELIAEDPKSAEIIRPILRGRDISRYSYNFADLYIITTFPSLKIDIENYPAVKQHLLSFGYDRLKQTGERGARKKTTNKWFETQDSISYSDDFNRQKIMYSEIVQQPQFYLDKNGDFFAEATAFILTGEHLEYLYHLLHSKATTYFFKTFYAGGGLGENGYRYKKAFLEKLPVPKPDAYIDFNKNDLDEAVYKLYELTRAEIELIETQ